MKSNMDHANKSIFVGRKMSNTVCHSIMHQQKLSRPYYYNGIYNGYVNKIILYFAKDDTVQR